MSDRNERRRGGVIVLLWLIMPDDVGCDSFRVKPGLRLLKEMACSTPDLRSCETGSGGE